MNLRNVGYSKFTVHHTILVEMCLHLKPTGFRRWVVHSIEQPTSVGAVRWKFESCHRLFASVTELADVSASEADVFMALRVRVPPLAFLTFPYFSKAHDHSTSCAFCFVVVLSWRLGIFRDTRVLRQGMLK